MNSVQPQVLTQGGVTYDETPDSFSKDADMARDDYFLSMVSNHDKFQDEDSVKDIQTFLSNNRVKTKVDGILGNETINSIQTYMEGISERIGGVELQQQLFERESPIERVTAMDENREKVGPRSVFVDNLGKLEGDYDHVDHTGIKTKAYGVVYDMENKPKLSKMNQRAAKSLNIDLETATPEESKQVATKLLERMETQLSKAVPNWDKLDTSSRVLMIDAKYNTGITFKSLPVALEKYREDPSTDNLKKVLKEARRKAGGKYSKGMDNRVAKLAASLGLIKNPNDAKELGLPLTNVR